MPMAWLFHTSAPSKAPFWFASTQMSYSPNVSGCDHTKVAGRFPVVVVMVEAFATALDGKAASPSGSKYIVTSVSAVKPSPLTWTLSVELNVAFEVPAESADQTKVPKA